MMESNSPKRTSTSSTAASNDEIDLGRLIGLLLNDRWKILATTGLFALAGTGYAILAQPIYKADALLQVEEKSSGMPALGEMGELFSSESSSAAEIELIKSRMILGRTVDELDLTTSVVPKSLPVIGAGLDRLMGNTPTISISRFEVPSSQVGQSFQLKMDPSGQKYTFLDGDDRTLFDGEVGKLAEHKGIQLFVSDVYAEPEQVFHFTKLSRLDAIQKLNSTLSVSERGKQTGMLQLSMTGADKEKITDILGNISQNYFLQNVARNSEEAEKSLDFLNNQIPAIKDKLTISEDNLNRYRQANDSVDLGLEAKATLDTLVQLEQQLNELTFKESEISQRFTKDHPAYISLLEKRNTLLNEKKKLNQVVQKLPKTQREILRLTRDVEVNQQIYVQMLNKVQELNIVKAGTVGNVRIIDEAQAYSAPVKPKKPLIVILATLLGGMFGVGMSLLKAAFHRGIKRPDEIEELGFPVYATIPFSEGLDKLNKKRKKRATSVSDTLLAVANPADLSIEAIRNLRTSLHFSMMDAKNNVFMISGPSPGIGKSFVSTNIAAVMASSGQRILLIDADMRKGKLDKHLCCQVKHGLSEYLSGQVNVDSIVHQTEVPGLDFIAKGQVPPNPSEILMNPRFESLLSQLGDKYDLIIIDTPPLLAVTDAAIIGQYAGTSMLVTRFNESTVKELDVTVQRFEQNGIQIKGVILNGIKKEAGSAYSEYGYYQYEYSN